MTHHCARAFCLLLIVNFVFSCLPRFRNGYKIKQIFEEDFKLSMVVEFHSLIFLPQEKKEIKHFSTNR